MPDRFVKMSDKEYNEYLNELQKQKRDAEKAPVQDNNPPDPNFWRTKSERNKN